eukprot:COSAG06_NODE_10609_length_1649_cov_16.675057_1_plen_126_part_00
MDDEEREDRLYRQRLRERGHGGHRPHSHGFGGPFGGGGFPFGGGGFPFGGGGGGGGYFEEDDDEGDFFDDMMQAAMLEEMMRQRRAAAAAQAAAAFGRGFGRRPSAGHSHGVYGAYGYDEDEGEY